jgi:hypothetical protein
MVHLGLAAGGVPVIDRLFPPNQPLKLAARWDAAGGGACVVRWTIYPPSFACQTAASRFTCLLSGNDFAFAADSLVLGYRGKLTSGRYLQLMIHFIIQLVLVLLLPPLLLGIINKVKAWFGGAWGCRGCKFITTLEAWFKKIRSSAAPRPGFSAAQWWCS